MESPPEASSKPVQCPARRSKAPLLLLLGLFFGLSTLINVLTPLWENIDEPEHFQLVKFVAENHRLPHDNEYLPSLAAVDTDCAYVRCVGQGTVTDQPPLYYVLVAPFVTPINLNEYVSWVRNPYFTWAGHPLRNGIAIQTLTDAWPYRGMVLGAHVMRAVSGLMGVATLTFVYLAAVSIRKNQVFGLAAAASAGFAPGYLLTTAAISNDNAAAMMGSLALLFGVKALNSPTRTWVWLFLYAAATAVGFQAKNSLIFLVPIGVLLALLSMRQTAGELAARRPKVVAAASFSALGVIAVAATFKTTFFRSAYTSVAAVPTVIHRAIVAPSCTYRCPNPGQGIWGGIPNMFETYWGSFGWETFHLAPPFYRPFLFFSLLALAGMIWVAIRSFSTRPPEVHGASVLTLALAFVTLLAIVVYRDMASHNDGGATHGRFLFPALLASSLFLAVGLWALPKQASAVAFAGLFATCFSAIGYAAWILPHSFGPVTPVYGDLVAAGVQQPRNVAFEQGMRFRGYNLATDVIQPGESLRVELFWDAYRRINFDYSAFLRLNDEHGTVIHDTDHGLGQEVGLLSHDWQPGEIVPDHWVIPVPQGTPPGEYDLQVGLYDYRNMKPVLDESADPALVVARVRIG